MSGATLATVREVLSTPAAIRFFEAWASLARERQEAESAVAEFVALERIADVRVALAAADAERLEALAATLRARAATAEPLTALDARAEADATAARAATARAEAAERRRRIALHVTQRAAAERVLLAAREQATVLRADAAAFGATVGDVLLAFADAERPGAAFVVALEAGAGLLEPFVLYRTTAGRGLDDAVAIRDALPPRAPSDDASFEGESLL
jgi:hypothetical protein